MRLTNTIGLTCLVLATLTWETQAQTQRAEKNAPNVPSLVAGGNAFALDLYTTLRARPGNLFFSPHSIHAALGMTYGGARGRTAQQMAAVLHFDLPQDTLHPAFAALLKDLNASQGRETYRLIVANALWGQQGYPFHRDFQKLLETHYKAAIHPVDFARNTESARNQINRWAAKQTSDKIKDLVPPNVLTPMSRLVLTNAIYFNGAWAEQFTRAATQNEPFRLSPDKAADVPMMYQKEQLAYLANDELQAAELPYAGHDLSMLLLLPRKVDGLGELEKKLTVANLDQWQKAMNRQPVRLWLPRFKMTCQFNLASPLQAMGMPDAFSPNAADFSGTATAEKLGLQEVIHKAFVEVNEEGTEAAAATAVAAGVLSAAPPPTEPTIFRADHPFLFLIRHRPTGQILFIGRVADPRG